MLNKGGALRLENIVKLKIRLEIIIIPFLIYNSYCIDYSIIVKILVKNWERISLPQNSREIFLLLKKQSKPISMLII